MPTYQLLVFSWNDILPSRPQSGGTFDLVNETFTFNGGGDIVNYTDTDSLWGSFGDHGNTHNRIEGTIDGNYVNNGNVNPEYSYVIHDSNGNTVGEMYAITLNTSDLADVEAFVFDFQPVKGETYKLASVDSVPATPYSNLYVCYAGGTRIDTADGPKPVETIVAGDRVVTRDGGAQRVIWTGRRRIPYATLVLKPRLRPILIEPGALSAGVPAEPLVVSPQHRVLLRSPVAHRMFGKDVVLLSSKKLLALEGVQQIVPDNGVSYHHLLCEGHQIIRANGLWAETLYLGDTAVDILGDDQLDEIRHLCGAGVEAMDLHPYARLAEANRGRLDRLIARENQRRIRSSDTRPLPPRDALPPSTRY